MKKITYVVFLSWDHFFLFSLKTLYRFMVCFDLFIPSVVLGFYHVQWFCFLNKIHKSFQCSESSTLHPVGSPAAACHIN